MAIGRSRAFMDQICEIQRPNVVIDVSLIRDRRISQWGIVKSNVPVYLEPAGGDLIPDSHFGRTMVARFTAYFQGGEPVQENDRLLISGIYYMVESVDDFSAKRTGWHMSVSVREMGRVQGT